VVIITADDIILSCLIDWRKDCFHFVWQSPLLVW